MSPVTNPTQEQLRFPPVDGLSVRGYFDGGALSPDFGPLLPRGIDRRIGLTERLASAFDDQRHPSYIRHQLRDLFAQRIYQIACAYKDSNDANSLRSDPVFKLGLDHRPLDEDTDLASAPTFSRFENAATTKDTYRLALVQPRLNSDTPYAITPRKLTRAG
ncbi:MAG: Transposase DDE domain group 1 [Candidatus Kentron sp. G]|nr:MAG: Transposase DDE domain group 1 [Candidatus Kentron sp. G]VFN07906.1 MAG: Transposase DDE domain group 1 [Candidatus Kentron sp. G]